MRSGQMPRLDRTQKNGESMTLYIRICRVCLTRFKTYNPYQIKCDQCADLWQDEEADDIEEEIETARPEKIAMPQGIGQ